MGLFSGIAKLGGKLIKSVVPKLAGVIPGGGIIKTAVNIGGSALKKLGRKNLKKVIAGGVVAGGAGAAALRRAASTPGGAAVMGAAAGSAATAFLGGGGGGGGFSRRRINPGNIKAMRRAIRRVESGARVFSKFFAMKSGGIKGARGVRVKKFRIRRAA